MYRVSGGLVVPKVMVETFPAQTTSGTGFLDYWLRYPPISVLHLNIAFAYDAALLNRFGRAEYIISGRHLWCRVYKLMSPGGGAECTTSLALSEAQPDIIITYGVG